MTKQEHLHTVENKILSFIRGRIEEWNQYRNSQYPATPNDLSHEAILSHVAKRDAHTGVSELLLLQDQVKLFFDQELKKEGVNE